ncbi:MAG TPA: transposase [Phormidium sp.]
MLTHEIAIGKAIAPTIVPTRKEYDFANHIANTIETDRDGKWIFLVDQLNIHKSASLVRLVAACCQIDTDLGIKEQQGILKSMDSRAAFLSDTTHRIHFVYIPKHTSWLNQIECWFSILVRRLLRRASFTSTTELSARILEFIDYFNRIMSKPFRGKYKGCKNTP